MSSFLASRRHNQKHQQPPGAARSSTSSPRAETRPMQGKNRGSQEGEEYWEKGVALGELVPGEQSGEVGRGRHHHHQAGIAEAGGAAARTRRRRGAAEE